MGCVLSFIRLFATTWTVACQAPLSMGILQARILEWIAMSSSRGSSQPRDRTQISCITCGFFTIWATRKTSILDWLAYPFFKGSSWPRDRTGVSCTAGGFLTTELPWKPLLVYPDFQNVFFTMEHNLFFRDIHSDQNWQRECFCWSQVTWELYLSNLIRHPFGIRRKEAYMANLKT